MDALTAARAADCICGGRVQAVRGAVAKRLEWLDANFLSVLNAYLGAPSVAGRPELAALLGCVRDEVLGLVSTVGWLAGRSRCRCRGCRQLQQVSVLWQHNSGSGLGHGSSSLDCNSSGGSSDERV